jgi:hypothetical protein
MRAALDDLAAFPVSGERIGQHSADARRLVLPDPVPEHIDDAQTQPYPAPGNA